MHEICLCESSAARNNALNGTRNRVYSDEQYEKHHETQYKIEHKTTNTENIVLNCVSKHNIRIVFGRDYVDACTYGVQENVDNDEKYKIMRWCRKY